ncbi:MAG: hypothetical protein R2780_13210 [Crocinitomicaceae bacterium]|nr:hypothetical protein [Crocinitomicaceae bacterium]
MKTYKLLTAFLFIFAMGTAMAHDDHGKKHHNPHDKNTCSHKDDHKRSNKDGHKHDNCCHGKHHDQCGTNKPQPVSVPMPAPLPSPFPKPPRKDASIKIDFPMGGKDVKVVMK